MSVWFKSTYLIIEKMKIHIHLRLEQISVFDKVLFWKFKWNLMD